jgi:hypothetical protein
MWPFKKRKPESPEEIAAEKKLDEVTRDAAWGEFGKEAARERVLGPLDPLGVEGLRQEPLLRDPDPGDEHGLREAFHGGEEEYEKKLHGARPEPSPDEVAVREQEPDGEERQGG